ncbi:hypothetical protein B0H13DRAFT_1882879 [Mycena leptocephala]|nr:hypothetical protein B0H13DRAFT_1882879 [Mycena leptocephala]
MTLITAHMQARNALPPAGSPSSQKPVRVSLLHLSFRPIYSRSTDWDRLILPVSHVLKNKLKYNTSVTVPFTAALAPFQHAQMLINDAAPDGWVGAWISSVFDVAICKKTRSRGQWNGWDKDKSYCQPCPTKFLEEHVWRWLLEERVKVVFFGFHNGLMFFIFCFSRWMGATGELLVRLRLSDDGAQACAC